MLAISIDFLKSEVSFFLKKKKKFLFAFSDYELSPAPEHSSCTRDLANSYQTIQIRYQTCCLDPIHPASSLCVLGLTSKKRAVWSSTNQEGRCLARCSRTLCGEGSTWRRG